MSAPYLHFFSSFLNIYVFYLFGKVRRSTLAISVNKRQRQVRGQPTLLHTMQSMRINLRLSSLNAWFPFRSYAAQMLLAMAAVTRASVSP